MAKERSTTSLTINKEDLPQFKKLKAKETGRRGASVSQPEFIRFLLCLYEEVVEQDSRILEEAQRREDK
ncbi:MAG: hypothetical protein Q8P40_09570 [Nitrospirota bacterium]|nr:hypothetical protein [Nitrospirota bacterium]